MKFGFPLAIVDAALNAYKMERVITYEGLAATGLFPTGGIVAGDSLSDVLVKLYYLDAFDTLLQEHPDVDLQVCFDDIQLALRGPPPRW